MRYSKLVWTRATIRGPSETSTMAFTECIPLQLSIICTPGTYTSAAQSWEVTRYTVGSHRSQSLAEAYCSPARIAAEISSAHQSRSAHSVAHCPGIGRLLGPIGPVGPVGPVIPSWHSSRG